MSRPLRSIVPLILVSGALASVGCETIYRPMYTPRRTHYVIPPKQEVVAPVVPTTPSTGTSTTPTDATGGLLPPPATPPPSMTTPAPEATGTPATPGAPTLPGL